MLPVFKTDLSNHSDNDERFFGFEAECIVLQEAVADSDLTLMKLAVSIHRTAVTDSNGDWDEDITIGMGGVGERGRSTIDSPEEIAVRTTINTDLDRADASQLDFFYQLFHTRDQGFSTRMVYLHYISSLRYTILVGNSRLMFPTIAGQTNQYARIKITAVPSLPCRK